VWSHLTSKIVQLKGPEWLTQQDTLPWRRWARPTGFMIMVNNHQATKLEASGTIAKQTLVFVRSRCSKRFILDHAEWIWVKAVERDKLGYVEMASGAKQ
jgi:hypothetical protein